jgi:hypothetical protein
MSQCSAIHLWDDAVPLAPPPQNLVMLIAFSVAIYILGLTLRRRKLSSPKLPIKSQNDGNDTPGETYR